MCSYYITSIENADFIVLGTTRQEIKFVSNGDSAFLPCIVNASNNIYPQPDHVKWWKDNIQCGPLKCEVRYKYPNSNAKAATIC